MGLLLMITFFVPGTALFLFFIATELIHQDYTQALAFAFPLLVFLCGMIAFWENRAVSRQMRDKRLNRLTFLTQLTEEVASQVLANPEPAQIEEFLGGFFLSHRERLYVMYVGWQKALDELMHNPAIPGEQRRHTLRQTLKNKRYQEMMTVHAQEVKAIISGFEDSYEQAWREGDNGSLLPHPDKSLRESFETFVSRQLGHLPLAANQTLPADWQQSRLFPG